MEQIFDELPIFSAVTLDDSARLKAAFRVTRYARGETIFSSGDPAAYVYVVLTGRMKVFFLQPDGREQILYLYGAGEFIGGLNVMQDTAFIYNAQALEDSTIGRIDRAAFLSVLANNEAINGVLMRQLWSRLRWAEALVGRLSIADAETRVIRLLLDLIPQYGTQTARGLWLALTITQDEMGGLTGLSRETVTRQLKRLSEEGLIAMERGKGILLKSMDELQARSQS